MAASLPGAIDGARAHARRSARDIATITVASALLSASSLSGLMTNGGKPSPRLHTSSFHTCTCNMHMHMQHAHAHAQS